MSQQTIDFTLNGVPTRVSVPVQMSALEMIRNVAGLTGTKYGCGEGECGACTIILDGVSLNSCLLFAVECDGRQVTTIEAWPPIRSGCASRRPSSRPAPCSAASARLAW